MNTKPRHRVAGTIAGLAALTALTTGVALGGQAASVEAGRKAGLAKICCGTAFAGDTITVEHRKLAPAGVTRNYP